MADDRDLLGLIFIASTLALLALIIALMAYYGVR
jgi:hypothetical protein